MKKIFIFILFFIFPLFAFAESIPAFPMSFWGEVTIDGNPAPVGSTVRVYYGDELAGEVILKEEGIYGYSDPTKQKLVVGEGEGLITFKIESDIINGTGSNLETHSGFESGETILKNLEFISDSGNDTSDDNGGSSNNNGSSNGGGGGGGWSPSTYNEGDINEDGSVDVLDFNTLMVNWGDNPVNSDADLNNDDKVDILDFNTLMVNWE